MTTRKISEIATQASALEETDRFEVTQGMDTTPATRYATPDQVADYVAGAIEAAPLLTSVNGLTIGKGPGTQDTNTVLGFEALDASTFADESVAIGYRALASSEEGYSNVGVGWGALEDSVDAGDNTALGALAMRLNVDGFKNVAVGSFALVNNQADNNTATGQAALLSNTTGGNNSALGKSALLSATTGSLNVACGYRAGLSATTGSRNTLVGSDTELSSASGIDQIVVGNGLVGKGDDTAFIGGTNGAYNEKNVTTWETTSDERIKKHITDNTDGLAKIQAIRVRNFVYRTAEEITEVPSFAAVAQEGVQLGVVAQEFLPECVSKATTGVLSVSTDAVLWYLVNAVKELSSRLEAIEHAAQ